MGKISAQSDSVDYWINTDYVRCLDSLKSPCDCGDRLNYLMLYIDPAKQKLIIEPAITTNWEDLECNLDKLGTDSFRIRLWGKDTIGTLTVHGSKLDFNRRTYEKIRVKKIESPVGFDMNAQLDRFEARPFLQTSVLPCSAQPLILSAQEIKAAVERGELHISCSDDYNYSELCFERNDTCQMHFFLVYESRGVRLYRYPDRVRREKVDASKLSECEFLEKKNP